MGQKAKDRSSQGHRSRSKNYFYQETEILYTIYIRSFIVIQAAVFLKPCTKVGGTTIIKKEDKGETS